MASLISCKFLSQFSRRRSENIKLFRSDDIFREGSEKNWFAIPSFVPGYGRGCGTVATWIGAAGDTTLIHSQARIYSSDVISDCQASLGTFRRK